ncbi:MAG: VCBS repeat-containing protein [Planctomycetota bacterium]
MPCRLLLPALLILAAVGAGQSFHRGIDWAAPPSATYGYGSLVTVIGDADLDGKDDVVVSDPQWGQFAGRLYVHHSSAAFPLVINGPVALSSESFGTAVARTGDLNGDGVFDFVVGHPLLGNGVVFAYSGADASLLLTVFAPPGVSWFGQSLDGFSDLDGDGVDDILVGAPSLPNGPGLTFLVSGATGAVLWISHSPLEVTLPTPTNTNWYGGNVSRLGGDVDGDLFEDLVVTDQLAGHVIVSGGTGVALTYTPGPIPPVGARRIVPAGIDVDGDGIGDYLSAGPAGGDAEVRSGADGSSLRIHSVTGGGFGSAAARTGDLDGDGIGDYAFAGLTWSGSAGFRAYSGATGAEIWAVVSEPGETGAAVSLDGPADAEGDAYPDLVVGAPSFVGTQVARSYAFARHAKYGLGNGPLTIDFVRFAPLTGNVVVANATPQAAGLVAVSLLPAQTLFPAPSVPILVDVQPASLVLLEGFPYPLSGTLSFSVALDDPYVVGIPLFFQAFDLAGWPATARSSNGLLLLFAP